MNNLLQKRVNTQEEKQAVQEENKVRNVKMLRDALCETFDKVKTDKISLKKAREMSYTANVILNSVKTEIRGNETAGIHSKVSFLIYDE